MRCLRGFLALVALAGATLLPIGAMHAGELRDGVLTVGGKPFFPLGSWNNDYTTPEDIARLGMNACFRGSPGTPETVAAFRPFVRRCAELGIQVVPYLSYGGDGTTPWPDENIRAAATLSTEPNLLAWYVGDDLGPQHLPGLGKMVGVLRREVPGMATVADYIAHFSPEVSVEFRRSVDISCGYGYPIPRDSLKSYMSYMDYHLANSNGQLWTWVQAFSWARTATDYGLGINDDPGPLPEPEQVRMVAHAALNRGLRGLLFFPHRTLHVEPELAAEVALFCREARLFNDELAAGTVTTDLRASDPELSATAFHYDGATAVSAFVRRHHYHRWVDSAIVADVTVQVPWPEAGSRGRLPKAVAVQTPDVLDCAVAVGSTPGTIAVTIPRFEIAGFLYVTNDERRIARVRRGVRDAVVALAPVAQPGAIAQMRKVSGALFAAGLGERYPGQRLCVDVARSCEQATDALVAGRHEETVRAWRTALRQCRVATDSLMRFAESYRDRIPPEDRRNLDFLYAVRNVKNLMRAVDPADAWRDVPRWKVVGSWPLGERTKPPNTIPPGFTTVYPPETNPDLAATYETMDGPAGWKPASPDISGLVDLLPHFATTADVVCYAQCTVIAPEETDMEMGFGSNDGARVWLNGTLVHDEHKGGRAFRNDLIIPIHLKAGENRLFVKVENLGASWGLYTTFKDPERRLIFRAD